jgi:hypothetical protein
MTTPPVKLPQLKFTSTPLFSLASSLMERPSFHDSKSIEHAIGSALAHVESSNEDLGVVLKPHANEENVDQSTLTETISRRYSHPDIQYFLKLQPDIE